MSEKLMWTWDGLSRADDLLSKFFNAMRTDNCRSLLKFVEYVHKSATSEERKLLVQELEKKYILHLHKAKPTREIEWLHEAQHKTT